MKFHQCEWCENPAFIRFEGRDRRELENKEGVLILPPYLRYSCVEHIEKVRRLLILDGVKPWTEHRFNLPIQENLK